MSSKRPPRSGGSGNAASSPSGPPAASPFSALAGLRDALPAGPAPAPSPPAPPPRAPVGPARAVVRLERKGRNGKDVTVVDKLGLGADELERWTRELKQALGTGGVVDGATIVLQGDVRSRLEPVLVARGVRKVVMG